MDKGKKSQIITIRFMKALLGAYLLTGFLLLLLSFLLYRLQLSEGKVNIGIVAIYVVAGFVAGFLEGKMMKNKKFLWGTLAGFGYFVILGCISLATKQEGLDVVNHFLTTLVLCTAGGTLGGMLS